MAGLAPGHLLFGPVVRTVNADVDARQRAA